MSKTRTINRSRGYVCNPHMHPPQGFGDVIQDNDEGRVITYPGTVKLPARLVVHEGRDNIYDADPVDRLNYIVSDSIDSLRCNGWECVHLELLDTVILSVNLSTDDMGNYELSPSDTFPAGYAVIASSLRFGSNGRLNNAVLYGVDHDYIAVALALEAQKWLSKAKTDIDNCLAQVQRVLEIPYDSEYTELRKVAYHGTIDQLRKFAFRRRAGCIAFGSLSPTFPHVCNNPAVSQARLPICYTQGHMNMAELYGMRESKAFKAAENALGNLRELFGWRRR